MKRTWRMLYAARFVAKWEGFLSHAYLDTIANPAIYTIGYGHTGGVQPGWVWSKAKALRVLASDLRTAAHAVARGITRKMSFRQRIAFISLAFNCGPAAVEGSTVARLFNEGRIKEAADAFLDWSHAGGVVVEGLLNRRKAERYMILHPGKAVRHNPHKPGAHARVKGPSEPHKHEEG